MKKLNELDYTEKKEFAELMYSWLGGYTDEVIRRVRPRFEEILNNEFSMMLLKELKKRKEQEKKESLMTFEMILDVEDELPSYLLVHNHPLTHAGSYVDILHDMYIK